MARLSEPSPYVEFDRTQWRALRMSTPLKLTEEELIGLRGMGEQIDLLEVEEVYLPLAQEVLGRNDRHMEALGMSLHMRHQHAPIAHI